MKNELRYLCSALILVVGVFVVSRLGVSRPAPDAEIKLQAADRLEQCFAAVRELRVERGLPFTPDDINRTGLIGEEYSFITTTLGNLEAKRSTVDPNWAAVVVDMFTELGLKSGDRIAVNCSGSFPALSIAVLCAADACGLDAVVISSFGASTHGANEPELTYQDMEHRLAELGLIRNRTEFFSIGGRKDIGGEMDSELSAEIVCRLEGYGYGFLYEPDLQENIRMRYGLYKSRGTIKSFVNVGGNDVSFGDSKIIVFADGGILTQLPDSDRSIGLVQLFLRDGVPVIHLLNIKSIAARYGIPIDPAEVPHVGEGGVYSAAVYPRLPALMFLAAGVLPLIGIRRRNK